MSDYQTEALRTEAPISEGVQERIMANSRAMHGIVGICTEAGELADVYKKHVFYGRALDAANVREEIGDICWYLAILCDTLGTTIEAEMDRNIAKLRQRYPERFTEESANVRDLEAERSVLEGHSNGWKDERYKAFMIELRDLLLRYDAEIGMCYGGYGSGGYHPGPDVLEITVDKYATYKLGSTIDSETE